MSAFADSHRCGQVFVRDSFGSNGGTFFREHEILLDAKEWAILESMETSRSLSWFENRQTNSNLLSAYIPTKKLAPVSKKLIEFLKATEGFDPKTRFEVMEGSQINIMKAGDGIGRHVDGGAKADDPDPYVFLIGLSHKYEGGDFVVYKGETFVPVSKTKLTERDLLILRPGDYHSVDKVVSGERVTIAIRVQPKL